MMDPATRHAESPSRGCTAAASCPKLGPLLSYLHGLDTRADLGVLARMLGELDLTAHDLDPWCEFGDNAYKRNTIARTEWFELLALCWRSRQATPIHDHKGSSCAFRVIEGTGLEIRFQKTECGLVAPTGSVQMNPGYVCAAEDDDIHQVVNAQCEHSKLITLHIYSPSLSRINTYDAPGARVASAVDGSGGLYA